MSDSEKKPAQLVIDGFDASKLSYGDILNHSDINAWSGIEYPDMDGLSRFDQQKAASDYALARLAVVECLRDYMLSERMMYLLSVPGCGYRIVEPSEQTNAAVTKGMKGIGKNIKQMVRGIGQVNTSMLTHQEREYNASVKGRVQGLATMIGRKRDYLKLE